MDLKSVIKINYICNMLSLIKITQEKRLSLTVLFFYVLLYLCITFHFHPLYIYTENEVLKSVNPTANNNNNHANFHCEICHITASFNYLKVSENNLTAITFLDSKVIILDNTFHLNNLLYTSQLRAPPIV